MKTTQQRHAQRIQRVIDHIHGHSTEDIDSANQPTCASRPVSMHIHRYRAPEHRIQAVQRHSWTDSHSLGRLISQRAPLRLVGLRHSGNYHQIGRVFEKVMAAAEIESWPRSEAFTVGVYFDDPDVVPIDKCRSFAGIPVQLNFQTPEGYEAQEVSGGLHASCLHTGPYALLPASYRWLYREWLRESAHDARDIPCHEIYLNTPYNTPPAELKTLICLPLEGEHAWIK